MKVTITFEGEVTPILIDTIENVARGLDKGGQEEEDFMVAGLLYQLANAMNSQAQPGHSA